MRRIIRTGAVAIAVAAMAAGSASAKGHAQSNTEVPGMDVGVTTGAAQGLGGAKGNRPDDRGPDSPGRSADAGR